MCHMNFVYSSQNIVVFYLGTADRLDVEIGKQILQMEDKVTETGL